MPPRRPTAAVDAARLDPASIPRLLCFDGGGVRVAAALPILSAIEEASYDAGLGETTPVGALFDRIAGTSAGAILAAALCVRNPQTGRLNTARDLSAIFELCAKDVFAGGWWRRLVTLDGLLGPVYSERALTRVLEAHGIDHDTKLCDLPVALTVVAARADNGMPVVFDSTDPQTNQTSVLKAVLSSCACPGLLPLHRIESRNQGTDFVDGGLVGALDPTHAALTSVWQQTGKVGPHYVVSLGAGHYDHHDAPPRHAGILTLGRNAPRWMASGSVAMVDQMAAVLLGPAYHRLDPELAAHVSVDAIDARSFGVLTQAGQSEAQARGAEIAAIAADLRVGADCVRLRRRSRLRQQALRARASSPPPASAGDATADALRYDPAPVAGFIEAYQAFLANRTPATGRALLELLGNVEHQLSVCDYAQQQRYAAAAAAPTAAYQGAFEALRQWVEAAEDRHPAPSRGWLMAAEEAAAAAASDLAAALSHPAHLLEDISRELHTGNVSSADLARHLQPLLASQRSRALLESLAGREEGDLAELWQAADGAADAWCRAGCPGAGQEPHGPRLQLIDAIDRLRRASAASAEAPSSLWPRPPTTLSGERHPALTHLPGATMALGDNPGSSPFAHLFFVTQAQATRCPSLVRNDRGEALVGFLSIPEDSSARGSCAQSLASDFTPQARSDGQVRHAVGRAVAGYVRQALPHVRSGPVRLMLNIDGRLDGRLDAIADAPTGDLVAGPQQQLDMALRDAFGTDLITPAGGDVTAPVGTSDGARVLEYRVRDSAGRGRTVRIHMQVFPPDDPTTLDPAAIGSAQQTMARFGPHAVLCLGALGGGTSFRVEYQSDDGGLSLDPVPHHDPRHRRQIILPDNFSLARAIDPGFGTRAARKRTPA